jgi:hypothetical protein
MGANNSQIVNGLSKVSSVTKWRKGLIVNIDNGVILLVVDIQPYDPALITNGYIIYEYSGDSVSTDIKSSKYSICLKEFDSIEHARGYKSGGSDHKIKHHRKHAIDSDDDVKDFDKPITKKPCPCSADILVNVQDNIDDTDVDIDAVIATNE